MWTCDWLLLVVWRHLKRLGWSITVACSTPAHKEVNPILGSIQRLRRPPQRRQPILNPFYPPTHLRSLAMLQRWSNRPSTRPEWAWRGSDSSNRWTPRPNSRLARHNGCRDNAMAAAASQDIYSFVLGVAALQNIQQSTLNKCNTKRNRFVCNRWAVSLDAVLQLQPTPKRNNQSPLRLE